MSASADWTSTSPSTYADSLLMVSSVLSALSNSSFWFVSKNLLTSPRSSSLSMMSSLKLRSLAQQGLGVGLLAENGAGEVYALIDRRSAGIGLRPSVLACQHVSKDADAIFETVLDRLDEPVLVRGRVGCAVELPQDLFGLRDERGRYAFPNGYGRLVDLGLLSQVRWHFRVARRNARPSVRDRGLLPVYELRGDRGDVYLTPAERFALEVALQVANCGCLVQLAAKPADTRASPRRPLRCRRALRRSSFAGCGPLERRAAGRRCRWASQ